MAGTPMQGMHSLWYDHYKGAVYPLHLEGEPCCKYKNAMSATLLEACCSFIVRDSGLTRAAIDTVPPILCIHMMECALRGNHDRAIQALMSHWSLHSLVLSKLVPSVFSSLLPLYDSAFQSDLVRQGLRYTTTLAHTFLECLRQEKPTRIRYLDLTGFPTAEVILYYLTSHCMLVHNESRRNNMISLYNQAVHLAECDESVPEQHSMLDISVQNCIPKDISIEIKLDAFVTSESCHSELCKALTVSGFPESRFKLSVEKLSVTCLGGDRVNLLLKQVKPQQLKGLQLKYNSLRNTDFLLMAPTLQSMTQLTSLDLSCNHLSLHGNEPLAVIMRQALCTLVHLQRLDLSNNRIKTKLHAVLQGVVSPLKHLRLAGCGLTPMDIGSLSRFPFLESMEELDLSENGLGGPSLTPLSKALTRASCSLKLLELEDTGLVEEAVNTLSSIFTSMKQLLFMNLAANAWTMHTTLTLTKHLVHLSALKVLRLSFSKDCYTEEDEDAEAKDLFETSMLSILESEEANVQRCEKLKLVITDLEAVMS